MINSHINSHPHSQFHDLSSIFLEDPVTQNIKKDAINQDLLRKYMLYARRNVKPKLSEVDRDKITKFYSELRRESNAVGGITIAVRHIESVIRMAEGTFCLITVSKRKDAFKRIRKSR